MPKERGPWRKLPQNKRPKGTRCILVDIPDDDEWERQMFSDLERLTLWNFWERDPGKHGKPIADRWYEALLTWRHCDGSPSPIDDEFEDSMNLCDVMRWHNGKLQIMCCGQWEDVPGTSTGDGPGTGQPPPEDRPPQGQSKCYTLSLNGRGQRLLPFPVSTGDVVTITDARGGWTDGTPGWFCPDGSQYLLGGCVPFCAHLGGDPLAGGCHMALIGLIDGVATFSVADSPFTIPSGVAGAALTFQANDGSLSDNDGDITFNVCVQNGTPPPVGTWCYVMDFTGSDYGFTPESYAIGTPGTYVGGSGWEGAQTQQPAGNYYVGVDIHKVLSGIELTSIDMTFDVASHFIQPGHSGDAIFLGVNGTFVQAIDFAHEVDANDQHIAWSGDITAVTDLELGCFSSYTVDGTYHGSCKIKRVVLTGKGTNPFGSDNC